ncbi:MAG: hypothetical protein HYV66_03215 [Candidatus Sungbacteria bacterium]|uniref:Uncharacterized protein n=1 Tax=Candidatus Sungiibacteriota bacterium TaxID=2750080 RepID=A0A931YDZ4_9BACT|nr:hypothetical protein [Candidatus Sungbacteria bacterium]
MKTLGIVFILISFTGMAVFSVWGMSAHANHADNISVCLGSLTQGAVCPDGNPAASVGFHLNSFRIFSTSLPELGLIGMLILMSVLMSALWLFFVFFIPFYLPAMSLIGKQRVFETTCSPFKREKIFWSSLHENSPSNKTISF